MLVCTAIIVVLYALVALFLLGVLVRDGNQWRIKMPTRHSTGAIHDFFGQLSWGRFHRSSAPRPTHSMSLVSGGIESVNVRHTRRSTHLGSLPPRNSDTAHGLERLNESPTSVTVQPIDIVPRPDTDSTARSDASLGPGRKNTAKTIGNHGSKGDNNQSAAAQTTISTEIQMAGKAMQLRTLAFKVIWYPIGMCLIDLLLPV
jgi:hypothetical protein